METESFDNVLYKIKHKQIIIVAGWLVKINGQNKYHTLLI